MNRCRHAIRYPAFEARCTLPEGHGPPGPGYFHLAFGTSAHHPMIEWETGDAREFMSDRPEERGWSIEPGGASAD